MNTPSNLDELFFPVYPRPLQAAVEYKFVEVPRYRVINSPLGILGVKPAWLPEAVPRPPALGRHLVFSHEQADALSRELYQLTFGVAAQPQYWTAAPPVGEAGPLGAWAAVLYGQQQASVIEALRLTRPATEQVDTWETQADFAADVATFRPSLAFTNGFDYDDELTFYLLVTLPQISAHPSLWDDAAHSEVRRPVLVLKTGRFRVEYIERLHQLTGSELLAGARLALPELARAFRRELRAFVEHYYRLRQHQVLPNYLVPVALDLYDANRNERSVDLDDNLRRRMRRQAQRAHHFFAGERPDLAVLVRLLMHHNAFAPARFDRRAAEEVLTQRDAYRNLRTRLGLRTLDDFRRLSSYLDSQLRDYEAIASGL